MLKKVLISLVLCFGIVSYGYSQAGWVTQANGLSYLHSVYFVDSNTGWAVGYSGTILKTTVGGAAWISQGSGVTVELYSGYFVDVDTGWVVGESGKILKTTNGGASWIPQTSGTTKTLYSVYFVSSTTGWAVGASGTILKSTDGGASWAPYVTGNSQALYSVCFINSITGWAVGTSGIIWKTIDGGITWSNQVGPSSTLYSVYFINSTTGWAVGNNGTVVITTDGGSNWVIQGSGTPNNLHSVYFASSTTGWAVGEAATIIKSTDGGVIWTPQTSGTTIYHHLESVFFINSTTGWVVGYRGGYSGIILKTTNAGEPNQAPTVSITSPNNGQNFTTTNITVSGTANDADGSVSLVQVQVNGGAWQNATGTTNWSKSIILQAGSNTINVKAQDNNSAWSTTASVSATYTNQVPTINITSPFNGQNFSTSSITVSGTSSDPDGMVSLVQVQVNGGTWQNASGTTNWSKSVTLQSGSNTINTKAQDNDGDWSTVASVTVNSTVGIENLALNSFINIYPNPNTGEFKIEIETTKLNNLQMKLVNVIGQVVYEENIGSIVGSYKKAINLGKNASGTYTLQMISEKGTINREVIVK